MRVSKGPEALNLSHTVHTVTHFCCCLRRQTCRAEKLGATAAGVIRLTAALVP